MEDSIRKADILIEAQPYIQAFRGKVVVAKYGGSAIDNPGALRSILQDLIFLSAVGIRAVLVHGGGPSITRRLAQAGKGTQFIDGMRVTDRATMRIVKESLEEVNARLVREVEALGGHAKGLASRQGVLTVEPHPRSAQLGYVGSVTTVKPGPIRQAFLRHGIPVICPLGVRAGAGELYNVNADSAACEVAAHLKAEKLVLLTNVRGILRQPGDAGSLISHLSVAQAGLLIERNVVQEGMIPKIEACVEALRRGVKKTHIIDAAVPHALLLEIFTKKGIGTEIVR
ncbi:MAG: acetylglutamate kinase [Candidatus Omnitrophica bacterium]|nr:acetylglutamate kinase [Candidatus Omnitrophota bacterium]